MKEESLYNSTACGESSPYMLIHVVLFAIGIMGIIFTLHLNNGTPTEKKHQTDG